MRKWILKIHLWVGLASAVFLFVMGLSGAIIAFENDYDHWFSPSLWYVTPQPQRVPQQTLVDEVQQKFAPAKVETILLQDSRADLAQVYFLSNDVEVHVNPYNGAILGTRDHDARVNAVVGIIHQLHIRLVHIRIGATDVGKILVEIAGVEMLLMIPTGIWLWWRKKQFKIDRKSSWKRINWNLHSAVGIYTVLFFTIATFTGFFISFEKPLYWITNSGPLERVPAPRSTQPTGSSQTADLDAVLRASDEALPNAVSVMIGFPRGPKGAYVIQKRVPQDRSNFPHSSVYVDQFSGKVLKVEDFNKISAGYRVVRINRSIHTGDYWGLPSRIVLSLSSALLAVMAATGVIIWWKKLAGS
jgi:uncharacterized iron-regulated membrane protein|nr:PepSY-associated TM helix domain-containing protein [Candidatus Acidoferrales bacterium]